MSEHYYRYNADDAPIDYDLNNDEIYDYVLEREALKELDNVPPRCIKNLGIPTQEHFGNLKLKGGNMDLMQNVFIVLLVLVILYLLYCFLCEDKKSGLNPGSYIARLDY